MSVSDLAGRIALVTGGAKGIGRACCLALAGCGVHVAVHYHRSEQLAKETANDLRTAGVKACVARADVTSPEQITVMLEHVAATLGPVDLLVNNAGVFDYVSLDETTLEVWRRAIDVNLTSAFLLTSGVRRSMIDRGFGRIVNIASIAGLRPRPMAVAYAASKAGLISLTQSLGVALAPYNIRVNAVAPGLTDTGMIGVVPADQQQELIASTPMKRLGQPEEIANLVLFLLSDASSFMTGQTLVASGGRVQLP